MQSNEDMEQHYQRLTDLLSAVGKLDEPNKQLLADIALLRKDTFGVDETIHQEATKIRDLRRVAAQHAIVGPIVGALGVASGTIETVKYYGYRQTPKTANHLVIPASSSSLSAESLALYVTPKSAISGFLYEHKLRTQGQHPEQLLEKRLSDLDELEESVKKLSP